jgi:hypothetical protein
MKKYLVAACLLVLLVLPAGAQLTPQQPRMKDCNSRATGMTGDTRKSFISSCLSGASAEVKKPHCTKGKPCGDSCIPKDKVCHQ